jgi:hypothetical protein
MPQQNILTIYDNQMVKSAGAFHALCDGIILLHNRIRPWHSKLCVFSLAKTYELDKEAISATFPLSF